jgi:hypothetical protein
LIFIVSGYPRRSGGSTDDVAIGEWRRDDGLLDQAGEAVGDVPGGAAVEAEDVLVEVRL